MMRHAPVSRLASMWTICAIAVWNDWPIHQMDAYNAYVNADLEELIYLQDIFNKATNMYSS